MSVVYKWRLGQTIDDLSPPVGGNRTRRRTNTDVNTRHSYYLFCGNRTPPTPARSPFTDSRYRRRQRFFRRLGKIVLHHSAILRFLKQYSTVFLSLSRQPSKSHNVPKNTFHDIFHPTTALAQNRLPAPHRSRDKENFSSTTFQSFTACDFSIHPLNICLVHSKTTTGECFPYAAFKQQ